PSACARSVHELAQLGDGVIGSDLPLLERDKNVARLLERAQATVDEQSRSLHERRLDLASARGGRANGDHVCSGRNPVALQHRLARGRRRTDDGGSADGLLRRLADLKGRSLAALRTTQSLGVRT